MDKNKITPKELLLGIAAYVFAATIAAAAIIWLSNAGTWYSNELTANELGSVLQDTNPARQEQTVEKHGRVSGTVTSVKDYKTSGIEISISDELDNAIWCTAYLEDPDIAKLDIGDRITLQGQVKMLQYNKKLHIIIGNAITQWPVAFSAKIVNLEKA